MAIIGPVEKIKPLEEGRFFCPKCNDETGYQAKEVRRWFSLLAVPIFPLSPTEGKVECMICSGEYELNVLDASLNDDERAFLENFEQAILSAMLMLMMSDGHVDDAEVQTIIAVYAKLTDKELAPKAVLDHAEHIAQTGHTLKDYMESLADQLNNDGKRLVIRSMAMVANADGQMDDAERNTMAECGRIIGLPRTQTFDIIDAPAE